MRNDVKLSRYVDLRSDAGFKAVFCDPKNEHLLIRLLNICLPAEQQIVSIEKKDREQEGQTLRNKKSRLDLRCKDQRGRGFIVEIQQKAYDHFYARSLYYVTRAYDAGLMPGKRNYHELTPVYLIAFLCEGLIEPELKEANQLIHHFQMYDIENGIVAPKEIMITFALLSKAAKSFSECKSDIERLCYVLRESHDMEESPEAFGEDSFSRDLISAAEIANYTEEKQLQYERDMNYELDYEAYLDQSRRDGIKEGRAEGLAEGEAKGICRTALAMLKDGMPVDTITKYTGLSADAVLSLA